MDVQEVFNYYISYNLKCRKKFSIIFQDTWKIQNTMKNIKNFYDKPLTEKLKHATK